MKRKNSHTKTKTSNRVPPSVPKCVKKSADGYVTGFVQSPDHVKTVKFMFRKTNLGYSVFDYVGRYGQRYLYRAVYTSAVF